MSTYAPGSLWVSPDGNEQIVPFLHFHYPGEPRKIFFGVFHNDICVDRICSWDTFQHIYEDYQQECQTLEFPDGLFLHLDNFRKRIEAGLYPHHIFPVDLAKLLDWGNNQRGP